MIRLCLSVSEVKMIFSNNTTPSVSLFYDLVIRIDKLDFLLRSQIKDIYIYIIATYYQVLYRGIQLSGYNLLASELTPYVIYKMKQLRK